MNHTCICLPSRSWYSFTDPEGWKAELALGGWLHTEIDVRHRELNPDTVAHLSTNRAQRRLTSLIEANALTTMPDHQPDAVIK